MAIQNNTQFTQESTIITPDKGTAVVSKQLPTKVNIQTWLISYLSEMLEIDQTEIDVQVPFDRYGLDSSAAIALTDDLGNLLGYDLEPTLLYDYSTIEALSEHLVSSTR